jgi:23S rRNA (cytidine1920-2'-O)/16S rRNA (cytidine1409-2'-O)-methyltransferase
MSVRLDICLTERGEAESRSRAQELIKSGAVTVNGKTVTKASHPVEESDAIDVSRDSVCPYVSRGGYKLEAALKGFLVNPDGMVCADIGASSGGFTDCLLQNGAKKVYAIDSGSEQLHPSLRKDERVISIENCNARYLTDQEIPEPVDLMVMDVSFISQTKLYCALIPLMKEGALLLSLIKPQFEVGRSGIGKGGIVRDEKKRAEAVTEVVAFAAACGLTCDAVIPSPIRGGDGNVEFLACFQKRSYPEEREESYED